MADQQDANGSNDRLMLGFHPRVFAALGSDLVTNDLVAITELVKNSYDAFASYVAVSFCVDEHEGEYIEILDDGHGMSRKVLRDVWCIVATPYREQTPKVKKGRKARRVTGEKGLGRLSAARLGDRLELITKADSQPCWQITANWAEIAEAERLEDCSVEIERYRDDLPFDETGTCIRIYDLRSDWDDETLDELMDHLARLIPPFDVGGKQSQNPFSIYLSRWDDDQDAETAEIKPPDFLSEPKYRISGSVSRTGAITWEYGFTRIGDNSPERTASGERTWAEQIEAAVTPKRIKGIEKPSCGPFSFEIRAWDVDAQGVSDIARTYEVRRQSIRDAIRAHKGISLYRDGILVLPKSENSRDWLGLDRRRISDVGKRMSTTQMVGYVSVTADGNPAIKDTSDRERLVDDIDVKAFQHIIRQIVVILEGERQKDRLEKATAEPEITDLFSAVSGDKLVEDVQKVAKAGQPATKTVPIVKKFQKELDKTRDELERRFVYYSRLASVGTIAEVLVHEIRNRTTTINSFLRAVGVYSEDHDIPAELNKKLGLARVSLASLDRLAKTFSPLANRSYKRGRRTCQLINQIDEVLDLKQADLERHGIEIVRKPKRDAELAIDPGELSAVLLNLCDNAIYWLARKGVADREIAIRALHQASKNRVVIRIDDSGLGIDEADKERIFWPGVTGKPDGIGMGLTIAGEIISAHGGELRLVQPGYLGGASFEFDLPQAK